MDDVIIHFIIILLAVFIFNIYIFSNNINGFYKNMNNKFIENNTKINKKINKRIEDDELPDNSYISTPIDDDIRSDIIDGTLPTYRQDYRKLQDILKPASRRYSMTPNGYIPGGVFNIPTQGFYDSFQVMGFLAASKRSGLMLKLFGRRTDKEKFEYYTIHNEDPLLKIPLDYTKELYTDDIIAVPGFIEKFKVTLYDFQSPRYVPLIYQEPLENFN